jgi:DNA-binding NtrC family response regulator
MEHFVTHLKEILSKLPAGASKPLILYRFIIGLDEKGIVRHVIHEGPAQDLQRRFITLLNKDIREYFSIPKNRTVKSLAVPANHKDFRINLEKILNAKNAFPSRNRFEKIDHISGFFTSLPFSHLYLGGFPGLGIVGIVLISFLGQQEAFLSYLSANPFILLDNKGRIQAVNAAFSRHFLPEIKASGHFLGKDVSKFIDINPIELLSSSPGAGELPEEIPWVLQKDYKSRVWAPDPKQFNLLPLGPPINASDNFLKVAFEVNADTQHLPLVIMNGGEFFKEYFPDYCGYLIGYSHEVKYLRIKKQGDVVFEKAVQRLDFTGRVLIEVERVGPVFRFLVNGRLLMGFYDPDPLESRQSYQFLYSREQSPIRLYSIRIYTAPKDQGFIPNFSRISFLNKKENAFEVRQLVHRLTLVNNRLFFGFIFYNVSILVRERDRFATIASQKDSGDQTLVGSHESLEMVKEKARVAARTSVTVLIEGETGTGKELLARFIHNHSPQAEGPFIKLDCATLPRNLLESELFGYEKGAFTGADQTRVGRLEAAHRGTLFLDEIGNLDMASQAKLLNFLQDFTLVRVGSNKRIKVETRIVTALNRPLKQLVDEGTFRADLYYRLNIVSLQILPLRKRKEDISLLCRHFLSQFNKKLKRRIKDFTAESYKKLMRHDWPGNVRELENAIHKAMLFCESEKIGPELIELRDQEQSLSSKDIPVGVARALNEQHIIELLKKNRGIVAWAAKEARIGRNTFYRKMRKFNIDPESLAL